MPRPRQFTLLQLVAAVTAFAACLALTRFLLLANVADQLLRGFQFLAAVLVWIIMPAATCWSFYHSIRQTLVWPPARAVVMRYCLKRHEGQAFYHPVLVFELPEQSTITAISRWRSRRRPWSNGDAVIVRYDPTNPRRAEIQAFVVVWGLPLTCLTVTIGGALVLFWFR